MARLFLTPIDLGKLELLNPRLQQLASDPGSPVFGQFYYNTADNTFRFYNGSVWVTLGRMDQNTPPSNPVSMNSYRITNVAEPQGAQDAATKNYVDQFAQGLSWKDSVRAATTAAGTLASSFQNASVIDGVTLATGNRILVKNQAAGAENGIYTVNASGAPTRATDADAATELEGAAMFVQEGTTNADTAWILTTNAPINPGTTALVFSQFGAGASVTEGTGIDIAGNVISIEVPVIASRGGTGAVTLGDRGVLIGRGTAAVEATAAGAAGTVLRGAGGAANPAFGQVVLTTDVTGTLPVANGGTGGATAAAAKTALGFMSRFAQSYGDGAALSYNIDHNLNSLDVIVQVFRNSDGVEVDVDVTRSTVNRVIVAHAVAPTSSQYRVIVLG